MLDENEERKKILEEIAALCPQWKRTADDKIYYLYKIAKQAQYPVLEIGCGDGFYTIALAFGSRDGYNVPVYSIDSHTGLATVPLENPTDETNFTDSKYIGELEPIYDKGIVGMAESLPGLLRHIVEWHVEDLVIPITNYSEFAIEDVKGLKLELVLIDGDHRYHFVKKDFELYFPSVILNGYIVFDDTDLVGVITVINELRNREDLRIESAGAFGVVRPGEEV